MFIEAYNLYANCVEVEKFPPTRYNGFIMKIAIIGGGASGLMAALAAAKDSKSPIVIYERNNRVGKKLLATGNGRCNITNTDCGVGNYHGEKSGFVKAALDMFSPDDTLKFFEDIGLMCTITRGGRVFPYNGQASAVLDVLRFAVENAGVEVRAGAKVNEVKRDKTGGFRLSVSNSESEKTEFCDRLIISSGGKAAPSTGSDGAGFALLSSLGHRIIEPYPALTQLKTETAPLRGIRVNGRACVAGTDVVSEGEIQFTAYGLSGPAVMDISAAALRGGENAVVALDLMPHMNEGQLLGLLTERQRRLSYLSRLSDGDFLTGMLHKKVGQALLKHTGRDLNRLARSIKRLEFRVKGHTGWEHAQTTGGGADTSEFNASTMESKLVKGLFATGEVLDIYGDCGGYNLQWAWSSGYVAGVAVTGR